MNNQKLKLMLDKLCDCNEALKASKIPSMQDFEKAKKSIDLITLILIEVIEGEN